MSSSTSNDRELVLLEVLQRRGDQDAVGDRRLCLAPASFLPNSPSTIFSIQHHQKMSIMELTDMEIQQLKEQNHHRIKRVVSIVAITLLLLSFILIALSLSFGPKIDQLVSDTIDTNMSSTDLFLGPFPNKTLSS